MKKMAAYLAVFITLFALMVLPAYAIDSVAESQFNTAMEYFNKADYEHAFSYFLISGEIKGYAPSQNMLGICYRDGLGTEKDISKAEEYFAKAAEQGNSDAKANLVSISAEKESTAKNASKPVITSLKLDSKNRPEISWEKVDEAKSYKVFRKAQNSNSRVKIVETKETKYTSNSYYVAGKEYLFSVVAVFANGTESDYSDAESIMIPAALSAPKITTTIPLNSKDQPIVRWSAVTGASRYELFRSTDDKSFTKVVATAETEYTVLTCYRGKAYYFKVRAISEDGTEGPFSAVRSIMIPPAATSTEKLVSDKTNNGYIGTLQGAWSEEKVWLNDSQTGIFELDDIIRNCHSLTMTARFSNFEGHPEGVYYLYGRSEHGHWNQLGEFELTSNKENVVVKQKFEFTEAQHISITAFAIALHERNRAYNGSWSFSNTLNFTDVYVYE